MAIAPKFKPGQLVKYNHPANPTLGLVKSYLPCSTSRDLTPLIAHSIPSTRRACGLLSLLPTS